MAIAHDGSSTRDGSHESTHGDTESSSDPLLAATEPIDVPARDDITILPIENVASIGSELREFLERDA